MFKAKAEYIDNQSIEFGYPVKYPNGDVHIFSEKEWESFEVKPHTVKYCTGIKSVKGRDLYEGDSIRAYRRDDAEKKEPVEGEVTFLNGCFMVLNCTMHELYRLYQSDWVILNEY